tara:strand:- start:8884 stop:9036 length:153 start_codon:yes stop_codon:yes gene_type:complete
VNDPKTLAELYEAGELGEYGVVGAIDWGEEADVPLEVCGLENPESCESCQ